MKKIRAAIVGYGNIGSYVLEALQAAPDFEVAGVVRRDATNVPAELKDYVVVSDIAQIKDVDVAILCTPTRSVESYASKIWGLTRWIVSIFTRRFPVCINVWERLPKSMGKYLLFPPDGIREVILSFVPC